MFRKLILIFLLVSTGILPGKARSKTAPVKIIEIKLAGAAALRSNEFSGLAWFKDKLVLLPQYVFNKRNTAYGKLYVIPRKKILEYLAGKIHIIKPDFLRVETNGFEKFGSRGSGCEAISFKGDTCFVNIEISDWKNTHAVLLKGIVRGGRLAFFKKAIANVPTQSHLPNISDETNLLTDGKIITIHEANGVNVNPKPVVHVFSKALKFLRTIPFPSIEYRITDATELDGGNNFWAINYFFPGEFNLLKPPLRKRFNPKKSVERIIQFHYSGNKITETKMPPVNLAGEVWNKARNWEGLARLEDKGFLIITDTYPRTILAFVPYHFK